MKNEAKWKPSKYVINRGRLSATSDAHELAVGSRLMAGLIAEAYGGALGIHACGRLLDMGCGKAPLYAAYRPFVSDVQCIDWSDGPHGADYLDNECDLTGPIPYADCSFDTIILSDVLEHLPEPSNCWREMNRLLAPGGKVLLNVPFYYQVHEEPHDFYRFTEFALRRFAENSGLTVLELRPIGGASEILADVTAKLLTGARLMPIASAIQWAARSFGRTRWGVKVAEKTSKRFPFGYFMVALKPAQTSS
jgi:SAM-dependent methyltransferase